MGSVTSLWVQTALSWHKISSLPCQLLPMTTAWCQQHHKHLQKKRKTSKEGIIGKLNSDDGLSVHSPLICSCGRCDHVCKAILAPTNSFLFVKMLTHRHKLVSSLLTPGDHLVSAQGLVVWMINNQKSLIIYMLNASISS